MTDKYALVKDGKVINTVVFKGAPDFTPKEGQFIPCADEVGIGWDHDQGGFAPPEAPAPPPPPEPVDVDAMTEADFRRAVLKALRVRVKD